MATFLIAYGAVWLAVILYVMRLGIQQRRLRRGLEAMQSRLAATASPED